MSESEKPVAWRFQLSVNVPGHLTYSRHKPDANYGEFEHAEPLYTASQLASLQREALERAAKVLEDGYPRPLGTRYRTDGLPSKHDKCVHGVVMYEDCEPCAIASIRSLIGGTHD